MLRSPTVRDRVSFHRAKKILIGCLAALLLLTAAPASAAPMVSVFPSSQTVTLGQTFFVDFVVSGVTDLYAFQFGISFDPTILFVTPIDPNDPFDPGLIVERGFLASGGQTTVFNPGFVSNVDGTILFNSGTLIGCTASDPTCPNPITGVSGSGTLFSVSFTALAIGTSPIDIGFNPFVLDELLDSALNSTIPLVANGSVTVRPVAVPEPSALSMLLIGIAMSIVAVRWRRTTTATLPVR